MVRFLAASVAALSLMATSAVAQEQSALFGHFKTLCGEGQGDGARALTMGRSAGWAEIPGDAFAGDPDSPFDTVTVLMNAEDDGAISLLMVGTATQSFEEAGLAMNVCAVMGGNFETKAPLTPDPRPLLRQWVGMDMHRALTQDGMAGYAFSQQGGVRTPVRPSDAAVAQSAYLGNLHMILINDESDEFDGGTMMMYMRPKQ
ncbi:MAG: hypothetical protein JHC81_05640 [Brevundimonas sp.]|uniref:hypothetical protein n=1 Tax=Brevundimonas sp. TaxID=1871086 RepID=UPI001A359A63|nr:hypothetical protein [Brevundimonas sp.]MBJ7446998.1 hypothetical protein [Brevundimonas sp.]